MAGWTSYNQITNLLNEQQQQQQHNNNNNNNTIKRRAALWSFINKSV